MILNSSKFNSLNKLNYTFRGNFAFTLIELLVVIAIIGILSALIIVGMSSATQKANIAKSQVFAGSLRNSLMNDLISEWRFDGNANDSWSGGNNGALVGVSHLPVPKSGSDCVFGGCYLFDGSEDYIEVTGSNVSTSNLAITGAITLSVWAKLNDVGTDKAIMGRGKPWAGNTDSGYFLGRYNTDNKMDFYTYSTALGDRLQSNYIFNNANWHYVVATWDGTTSTNGKKIYIDGVLDNQKTSTISQMGQPNYTFRVGASGSGNFPLLGLIDEVRVFDAAMPTSQIQQDYFAGINKLFAKNKITQPDYQQHLANLSANNFAKE